MKIIKTVFLHEIKQLVYSFKFIILITISVLITLICVTVQVNDFEDRHKNYMEEVNKAKDLQFKVYSEFKIPVIIPPNPLSIFAQGVSEDAGNKAIISFTHLPELKSTSQQSNPFMDIFSNFDVISIVKMIFSLMLILMIADSISGERDSQTLKLVFTNNIGKFTYFGVKYLSALIMAVIPLSIIFLLSTLIIIVQPFISVGPYFGIKVILMFIICIFYISVFILLGLLISAKSPTGTRSIMKGLLIWLLVLFIYSSSVNYIINSFVEKPSKIKLNNEIERINKQFFQDAFEYVVKIHHGKMSRTSISEGFTEFPLMFIPKFTSLTQKFHFKFQEKLVKKLVPKYLNAQKGIMNLKTKYRAGMLKPVNVANNFNFFIPNYIMSKASEKIAGTDRFYRKKEIQADLRNYRNRVIEYLKQEEAIGLKFFTRVKTEDMKDNFNDYSEKIKKRYNTLSDYTPIITTNDVPQFKQEDSIVIPYESGILLLLNLILFVFGARQFTSSSVI